ncbi:MAG: glycosyltransferase family 4 protein [Lyngbya sp.]|nr:glycosyltransferase family 4 protein [Lyngbya sp.]
MDDDQSKFWLELPLYLTKKYQKTLSFMHIITVTTEPSSRRGGIEKSTLDICHSLANRGHQISLIYFKAGDLLEQYQQFCQKLIEVDDLDINKYRPLTSTIQFLRSISSARKQLEISDEKNTIIYTDDYLHCLFASLLAWQQKLPSVFHLRLPLLNKIPRKYLFSFKLIKHFIAVSNQTKLDWIEAGIKGSKISVVYNGINPTIFQPTPNLSEVRNQFNLSPEQKVISYVGRIDRPKGIETLIKACGLLCQKNGNSIKLLIVGLPVNHPSREAGEQYKRSLENLAISLGLENRVEFLGHVADIPSIYQASDLTVLPSLYSEPFGRTIIESMSCGVPVLGSKVGGIPEILTGEFAEGLFTAGKEEELCANLQKMIDWREKNPLLGARCRHHIFSNFSLDTTVDGVEKVFLQVINN